MARGRRPATLLALGLLLIGSGIWFQANPNHLRVLDRATAESYVEAATALHGATSVDHSHQGGSHEPDSVARARSDFATIESKVASAKRVRAWAPPILQLSGVFLCLMAVWGLRGRDPAGARSA